MEGIFGRGDGHIKSGCIFVCFALLFGLAAGWMVGFYSADWLAMAVDCENWIANPTIASSQPPGAQVDTHSVDGLLMVGLSEEIWVDDVGREDLDLGENFREKIDEGIFEGLKRTLKKLKVNEFFSNF